MVTDDAQLQGGLLAFDLNNSTTTTGIPEMFDDSAEILALWRFFFDVDNRPGNLLFAAGGSAPVSIAPSIRTLPVGPMRAPSRQYTENCKTRMTESGAGLAQGSNHAGVNHGEKGRSRSNRVDHRCTIAA